MGMPKYDQESQQFGKSTLSAEDQKVFYLEQVKQLYSNASVGLLATAINSILLVIIQRDVTSSAKLIVWMGLIGMVSLWRYKDISRFWQTSPDESNAPYWGRKFIVILALSGIVWGSSAILLFPIDSLGHQTFLAFVVGGMVAGAAGAFSSMMKAFLAYSIPALGPIIIRFALLGGEFHLAMGGMILLFGVMMFFIARRIHQVRMTSLYLRFENSGLVSYLSAEKDKLNKLNEKLLIEIDHRKRIGEELRTSEAHLRSISAELLNAYEKERKLVAQEIHDSIGASLAAAKFKLETALKEMKEDHSQARTALESITPIIQGTIDESRRIQVSLRPSVLDDLGILATINWFCRQFESTYSNIRIQKEIDIQEHEVPEPLKIVIYRLLQEGLNNIAKHSKALAVSLSLKKSNQNLELMIQDNGQGFDLEEVYSRKETTKGLGLNSMKERIELSGGFFSIESKMGAGTVIRATWSMDQ